MNQAVNRPWVALAWMMGALISFVSMSIAGREIQYEMNTFNLMLYRSAIGFIIVTVLVAGSVNGFSVIRTERPSLHVRRNIIHFIGQNAWFFSLASIPLAQAVSLEMTNPIWVIIFAPFFLGERLTRARIVSAIIGFIGVLIIARPGIEPLGWGHAAGLLAAVGLALSAIFTKQIMQRDKALCVLFWMTFSQTIMAFIISLPGGIPVPSDAAVPMLGVVAITGLTAHYCLATALSNAPAIIVSPMEFLRLPATAFVGWLIYDEKPELAVFLGAALIITGILAKFRTENGSAED